jgi:hypothetical protein
LTAALDRFQQPPILLGDLKADLIDLTKQRNNNIATLLANYSLLDMIPNFCQRKPFRHRTTFYQRRQGQTIRSRCDYILGTDRRTFKSVRISNPRHYTSDHYMIIATILRTTKREHKTYLNGRKKFPLQRPKYGPPPLADSLFDKVMSYKPPPPKGSKPTKKPSWISLATVQLIDTRATLRKNPSHHRRTARILTRRINTSLRHDQTTRAEEAGNLIYSNLQVGSLQQAFNVLKRWYRHATGRPPKPSREDLQDISNTWQTLYTKESPSPPGPPVPVHIQPYNIDDTVPTEDEIATAVRRLGNGRAPGHTGLKAEDIKTWLKLATRKNNPILTKWDALVQLVQHCFSSSGNLPEELTWAVLVILPKTNGGFRGIGLLEVIWKIISSIIQLRVKAQVRYHDIIHGFTGGRHRYCHHQTQALTGTCQHCPGTPPLDFLRPQEGL